MPMTRTDLRRAIGDRLGLMHLLTATADTDNSHFRDTVLLGAWGDDAPTVIRRTLYLSGGTTANLGHAARVTAYASASSTLTFAPAAPADVAQGDEAELWSTTHQITVGRIHRLLNAAIQGVGRLAAVEVFAEPATFNPRSPELTIPDTWVEFGGGTYTTAAGLPRVLHGRWWRVRQGTRTAELVGQGAVLATRRPVTLFGYAPPPLLSNDAQSTSVDAEWLIDTVLSALRIAMTTTATDPAAGERLGGFFDTNAKLYRRNLGTPRRGLGIAL